MFKKLTIVVVTSMALTTAVFADSGPSFTLQVGGKGGWQASSLNWARKDAPAVPTCAWTKPSAAFHPGGKGAYAPWSDNVRVCSTEIGGTASHDHYGKN